VAAYIIATVQITDPGAYEEYRRRVLETIERHGGRYLVRGGASEILEGNWQPPRVVLVEFPDADAARRWYSSDDYRPLIEIRQRAANADLLLVEGV
jgi:uncharacterized protein (DUF1330 family)